MSESQIGSTPSRIAAGTTYQIDKIIKYSSSEDYAVFSVLAPPVVVPLETRARPQLNTPVFAIGNALGEGVVIRDGLYTSDTPEDLDGRWQWLRFSAAASPGNSGGPLIDRMGKVVGVVLRKSPNENLNFALAIGQVLDGGEENAALEARSSYRTMVMKQTDAISLNQKIPLPKTLDEFYAASRTKEIENLCGFFYVSYTGSLAQWRAFLGRPSVLPTTLSDVQIEFDYSRGIGIRSSRFQLLVPATVLTIDANSVLMLKYSYLRDGAKTVWDLGGIYVANNEQNQNWVGLLRRPEPSASMPEEFTRSWHTMSTGAHPWEGAAFLAGGRTECNAMVNAKDVAARKTNIGYTLSLNAEGTQPLNKIRNEFSALERGFKAME